MVSGQVSESVHKGDYQAGTCAIGEVPLNFLSFFFFQVKLLCPGTSSKFAWAGSTLVSLISGIGLTLVVALLAYLGVVLRRGWSRREGRGRRPPGGRPRTHGRPAGNHRPEIIWKS